MSKFLGAIAAGLALTAALASTPHVAAAAQLPNNSAGLINPNGTIAVGTGFTVQHTGTGTYLVTYPTSTGFTSLPVVTVSPVGVNGHVVTAFISSLGGSGGGFQFTVQLTDTVNKLRLEDNGFGFILLES